MQENLSSVQDVQRQLLATVIDMGESLETLVNMEQPASSPATGDRVADSVSSRTGARGLSPLPEKDGEEEDWVGKGLPDPGQKVTPVKAFQSGTFGGSMVSEGHRDISPPKVPSYGTLGGPTHLVMLVYPRELARCLWVTNPIHQN